jgi:hypothetical protein
VIAADDAAVSRSAATRNRRIPATLFYRVGWKLNQAGLRQGGRKSADPTKGVIAQSRHGRLCQKT